MKKIHFLFLLFPFLLPAQSLTDSLKLYYPFTGNAQDASGYGHNASTINAALATDRFGSPNEAYAFDGLTTYIEYTPSNQLRPTTFPVSVSLWFNSGIVPVAPDYYELFCTEYNAVNGNYSGYWMNIQPNSGEFAFSYGDNTGACSAPYRRTISSNVSVCDGQWHLLSGVIYSATNMEVFIDCQQVTGTMSGSGALSPGFSNSAVGRVGHKTCGTNPSNYHLNGFLDEVRFYNRALSLQDVINIYNYPNPISGTAINLGNDTTVCNGSNWTLDATTPNAVSYSWNTGATTSSINVSTSGNYWVNVDLGGCMTDSDTINIAFNNGSQVNSPLTLGADILVCQGSTNYTLNAITPNAVSYSWSTGATTSMINVQNPGSYWVEIDFGNCTYDRDTIVVSAISPTQGNLGLNLGNDTSVCVGAYLIDGTISGGQSFLWSTGATTPTISVSNSGAYWVTVYGANCVYDRDTIDVTILSTGVSLVPDTIICKKGAITLNAPPGYITYLWSTGSTGTSITTGNPGNFALTVTAANGCSYTDSIIVSYVPYSIPAPNFTWNPLSVQGSVYIAQFTSISSGMNMSYYWDFGNGTTSTLQSPILTLNCGVSYPVMLVVYNECGGDTTYQNVVLNPCVMGIPDNLSNALHFVAYPQPASGELTVEYSLLTPIPVTLTLYNLVGETVKTWEYITQTVENKHRLSVEGLAKGVYYLKLKTENGSANIPIILQ